MPGSFRHGFDTAEAITGIHRNEQIRNLLDYINNLEENQSPDSTQRVAIYLETKFVKEKSKSAVGFNWTDNPGAPAMTVREEDIRKKYPWTYKQLTDKMKTRYRDFVANRQYHKLRKDLEKTKQYCITRFLDPGNPKSTSKRFYNSNILQEFDKHYHRQQFA